MSDSRMVIAYHGTTASKAVLIQEQGFKSADNGYDWLGPGIYFFEHYNRRAARWAKKHHPQNWAVLRCEIELRDCLDLDSGDYNGLLLYAFRKLEQEAALSGLELPRQVSKGHRLDHMVVQFLVRFLEAEGKCVRCVRRSFIEGDPVYPESAITTEFHTQLCVVDPSLVRSPQLFQEGVQ
jgi:hypothetical protein